MKVPDKIWLNKLMIRPGMLLPAQFSADEPEFEYIRKDAILDKLKTQRDKCIYRSTYWDFWQAVINQINEI